MSTKLSNKITTVTTTKILQQLSKEIWCSTNSYLLASYLTYVSYNSYLIYIHNTEKSFMNYYVLKLKSLWMLHSIVTIDTHWAKSRYDKERNQPSWRTWWTIEFNSVPNKLHINIASSESLKNKRENNDEIINENFMKINVTTEKQGK